MSDHLPEPSERALASTVHEIVDFVDAEGWDRPPVLFALVPTALLAASEPTLSDHLDDGHVYTPIVQEPLPGDLDGGGPPLEEFLATTSWPESVAGCALVQEIVVLPPGAEGALGTATREAAAQHPDGRRARLVTAVLRDGPSLSLLELQPTDDDPFAGAELRTADDLAPHLVAALYATFDADPD